MTKSLNYVVHLVTDPVEQNRFGKIKTTQQYVNHERSGPVNCQFRYYCYCVLIYTLICAWRYEHPEKNVNLHYGTATLNVMTLFKLDTIYFTVKEQTFLKNLTFLAFLSTL